MRIRGTDTGDWAFFSAGRDILMWNGYVCLNDGIGGDDHDIGFLERGTV